MSERFNSAYEGIPPWDIGKPQPVFVRLAEQGKIRGVVLDVGCGTGENAIFLAEEGYQVVGVDTAPLAVEKAIHKATARDVYVEFRVEDALNLSRLGKKFDTVIDSGVFHVFDDEDRKKYVRSIASVIKPNGRYYILCFSDREPGDFGPRRVSKEEIYQAFASGWKVLNIAPAAFETNLGDFGSRAWLVTICRNPDEFGVPH